MPAAAPAVADCNHRNSGRADRRPKHDFPASQLHRMDLIVLLSGRNVEGNEPTVP